MERPPFTLRRKEEKKSRISAHVQTSIRYKEREHKTKSKERLQCADVIANFVYPYNYPQPFFFYRSVHPPSLKHCRLRDVALPSLTALIVTLSSLSLLSVSCNRIMTRKTAVSESSTHFAATEQGNKS
jgi:hypothetical protein